MFKKIFTILFIFLVSNIIGQVSSEIEKVKVFQNGAQIYRKVNINIKKGPQKIVINQLSSFIKSNTIQANIKGVKILDIEYNINYLEVVSDNQKITNLKEALTSITFDIQKEENTKSVLNLELELILSNQNLKGQESLDIEDLKEFIEFYKSKIPDLKSKLTDTDNQIEKYKTVKYKLKKQLKILQKTQKESSGVIIIKVIANKAIKTSATINYHTENCGWTPIYSLRATDLNSPINFEYAAKVYQNTGVIWNNSPITLVTGNPVLTGQRPELSPWIINNYGSSYLKNKDRFIMITKDERNKVSFDKELEGISRSNSKPYSLPSITSQEMPNLTFSEFNIQQTYTLESGAEATRIVIDRNNLPASYEYYCAPKINNSVFLIANISGWEKLSLIPGKANIYFDNTYVGNSIINPETSNDTLEISLGQDQRIAVKRNKIVDKCKSKTIGLSKKHNRAYNIEIKNNRNNLVKIKIVDQIPVATNDKIKVEISNKNGAKLNHDSGILEWNFEIPPKTLKTTTFEFKVKHPRKLNVVL